MLIRRTLKLAIILSALALTAAPNDARAQRGEQESNPFAMGQDEEETKAIWSYDEKYRPEAFKKAPRGQTLLSNSQFTMHFARTESASPDEATLRFSQPSATSGCADIVMAPPEIMKQGSMMWVTLGAPMLAIDKSPRYDHDGCAGGSSVVQTDLVLNRSELLADKVKKITFRNDFGMDNYNVQITPSKITLIPESKTLFMANTQIRGRDVLTHWFYPEGTIVLSAPGAEENGETYEQIKSLAMSKGLIPLQSLVKGFGEAATKDKFYFSDPAGNLSTGLDRNKGNVIGTIKKPETFYRANGPEQAFKNINVYAKLPGALE